jgi:hypothetical protein
MKNTIHTLFIFLGMGIQGNLYSQVPVLNSCPSAAPTVYLEFSGAHVSATAWNNAGDIFARRSELTEKNIRDIFARISQDFHPFQLNITTDSIKYKNAPPLQKIRIIFTPIPDGFANASGQSFVGSFTWGDETPAWVFTDLLGNNPSYIAAAASHEIGHTLGLQHQSLYDEDGTKLTEYYGGAGNGSMSWSPIMGINFYKNLHTWYWGSSSESAQTGQNDLATICSAPNNICLRTDDYPNSMISAASIQLHDQSFSLMGVINKADDRDVFSFHLDSARRLEFKAVSWSRTRHIKFTLFNQKMEIVSNDGYGKSGSISFDRFLPAGKYYISVEAEGKSDFTQPCLYALFGGFESPETYHQMVYRKRPVSNLLAYNR